MRQIIFSLILTLAMITPAWAEVQDVNVLPPSPPDTPNVILVSGITETTASVSWVAVPSATQYSVYLNGEHYTGSNSPGAVLTGLKPYSSYSVQVIAHNAGGSSGQSGSTTFYTLPNVPSAPMGLTISDVKKESAKVTWQPNQQEEYIMVYRMYVDGQAVADVEPQTGIQTANLTNLSPGGHTVTISAVNENKEGPMSSVLQFNCTELPAPTGLIMTNHSPDTIWLQWNKVTNGVDYSVLVDGNLIAETNQASYEIKGLEADRKYTVSVFANLSDESKSAESSLQVKTLPTVIPLNISGIKEDIFSEIPNIMPNINILFAVICAFAITGLAKLSFVRRIRM